MGGVMAAPSREPACVMPCAKPRAAGSIQRDNERVAMGNAPDSPTPKMNRMASMDTAFQAKVVREVNILHQVTIIASARRGPILSPNQAPGSWKSVKPKRKLARIQPTVMSEKPNSFVIRGMGE